MTASTTAGSAHGRMTRARMMPRNRKRCRSASAMTVPRTTESTTPMTTYTAVLIQAVVTAELANSARKLPRPVNWVGGLSGDTRKNASTVVSTVGTNDSAPMNTTNGETRTYGRIRRRNVTLNYQPPDWSSGTVAYGSCQRPRNEG